MLRKWIQIKFERKRTNLKLSEAEIAKIAGRVASQTAGKAVRDATIKVATDAAYVAGNNTDKIVETAKKVSDIINGGMILGGGFESSGSLVKVIFKATKDIARDDKVCTGLCLISARCETVTFSCSTVKLIPYRGRIYIGYKIISRSCMSWRNACAKEGC
jgi:hypothetical protein